MRHSITTGKLLNIASILLAGLLISCGANKRTEFRRDVNFNTDWKFTLLDSIQSENEENFATEKFVDDTWEKVSLPHTAHIEPLVVNNQWQGICWYRKNFKLDPADKDKKILIKFEGAMQVADIWLNGQHLLKHEGGYLPFTIDLSDKLLFDKENVIAVRLDNRDNLEIPPGKPLKQLDFCMYGGLYRNVTLQILDPLHISDEYLTDKVAGGGVFVRYENVSEESADIIVQTDIINETPDAQNVTVISTIMDETLTEVLKNKSERVTLEPGSDKSVIQRITLKNPELWHPNHPYIYTLKSRVSADGKITDEVDTRIGIRTISISRSGGFQINGERMFLRGTNRHQEYPYIGYALSDNAQYRDAYKIKQAGFDYIRLSHYPHSPAFMNACDELGLVVMNCIPGWQHMGGDKFKELCYRNSRELIRRDRNHPSVIMWEVSLNETWMKEDFTGTTQKIAHEEYPGDQCYTCGWTDNDYDVFIQARQHGGCKDYSNGDKACIVSEYGDWEYYAQNAGLDQPGFKNLKPEERNSRQLRGNGEKRLLQQAMNFQEAHNDNRSTSAIGDGLWVMYDYNRGYDNTLEASGTMDIFRIPKFSYNFFQSQQDTEVIKTAVKSGPMVHIANYWDTNSPLDIRVYSNCEKVDLYLNDKLVSSQDPDDNAFTNQLAHPPFTFKMEKFIPGALRAVGKINGEEAASDAIQTPGKPSEINIEFDLSGRKFEKNKDIIFIYTSIIDQNGTVVHSYNNPVQLSIEGPGSLIGENPINAEVGRATILLQSKDESGEIKVTAKTKFNEQSLNGTKSIRIE